MVTPKKNANAGKPATRAASPAAGRSAASKPKAKANAPGAKAAPPPKSAPKPAAASKPAKAASKTSAAGSPPKGASRPAAGTKAGASPARKAGERPAPNPVERVQLLQQEKAELQEILRNLKAERDSALAEETRLEERVRQLEAEASRRSAREPQQAGPGAFDPSVDLDEEVAPEVEEEDFEGAASFFDRMEELRARRIELDRERSDRELEQSEQSFWMICSKCGELMEEQEAENVKLERCDNCGGLYLDRGEVELLLSIAISRDGLRRLHNILKF